MSLYLFVYLACLAACVHLIYSAISAFTSPLRSVPGPLSARVTNLSYLWTVWNGQAHHDTVKLHRRYAPPGSHSAPVVRLGPNLYSLSRPERVVYGVNSKMPKGTWYDAWKHPSPDRWTTFSDRDMARQAETRRKFQTLFSLSSLLHYEPFVDSALDTFRQRLTEMAAAGPRRADLHHWFQCYAFDVVGNITYGRRFGFLDAGEDIEHCMASLHSSMLYGALVGVYAWAHPFLYKAMEWIPGSGAAGRSYIMRMVAERLSERRKQRAVSAADGTKPPPTQRLDDGVPRDFLDLIMDAQEDESRGVTPYHVLMMGLSNVIGGGDTTALSLSAVLYYLLRNPRALARLREELDAAIGDGRMTREGVSFRESQALPYLQACIRESLRLCPVAGLPLWRVVPEGGAQISGHYFPAGAEVGVHCWVLHYDRDIWGEDAEIYRPERWVEADAERLSFMEAHYNPFGLGSRTCIGRNIAYLEMYKAIPMIVSNFDFELEHPEREWNTSAYWFVRPTDFRATVRLREQKV